MKKVITVRFEGESPENCYDLKQWDYGVTLRIEGLSLPEKVEVHFALDNSEVAQVYLGTTEDGVTTVRVPAFILENADQIACVSGGKYKAFAYIYQSDEESGWTVRKIIFHIEARQRPEDYIHTEEDIKTWERLEKRIGEVQHEIPKKVSELDNDEGYLTEESDPTVPGWAKKKAPDKSFTKEGEAADAKAVGDELDKKADKNNPEFTGTISLGRKVNSTVGENSVATGYNVVASGANSHAGGHSTVASGSCSYTEGFGTKASNFQSHAEGDCTIASGVNSHVQGKYNIEDTENKYAHIVGNGTGFDNRSNAHTVDWDGNGWYAGKLMQDGTPTEEKDLATKKYVDEQKTFVVEYGVTTIDEIKDAIDAKKNVIVKYISIVCGLEGIIYGELTSNNVGTVTFGATAYDKSYEFMCDVGRGWLVTEKEMATKKYVDDGLNEKLTAPQTAKVGQIFRVQSVNEDGTLTLEAVDMPECDVTDVQIDGTSIVGEDGVAVVPFATQKNPGVIKYSSIYGMQLVGGSIAPLGWNIHVDGRVNAFMSYVNIDYAVKAAMTDGKGAAWTADEQKAARARMGIGDWELIEKITLTETANVTRTTTPDGKTYADCNFKDFIINIENSSDVGSKYAYIYRIQDDVEHTVATALNVNAGENGIVYTRLITDGISEYGYYKTSSDGYIQPSRQGACLFSGCINRIIISGCTSGTIIKIYGVRA